MPRRLRTANQNNSGGNIMSSTKATQRRVSLLAGSSLAAASLFAVGMAITPTTAAAQAVCAPPPTTGAGANTVSYDPGTYDPGITCTASGGAMSVSTTGAITVSTTLGTAGAPLTNGVNLSGGTQNVIWNSTAGTVTAGAQTNGAIIEAVTTTGAINISTGTVDTRTSPAGEAGHTVTAGIQATSTTGAITINSGRVEVWRSPVGTSAIEAVSASGAINITTTGLMSGRLRGILAQTGGSGAITLNVGGSVSTESVGVAAIDTKAGTGGTTINITAGTVAGDAGPAIRSVSASTSATAAVNVQNTGGVVNGRVDFSGVSAGGVTFNNAGASLTTGRWTTAGASVFSGQNDTVTLAGLGNNTMASGTSLDFGGGADVFNLSGRLDATNTTLNFGAGTDAFNLSGSLISQGTNVISNLEALNLSGTIYMGRRVSGGVGAPAHLTTDGFADDLVRIASGTWTGSGSARVVMDVDITTMEQAGCETLSGGGDCLDLRGASTAGVTKLTLLSLTPNAVAQLGSYNPAGVTLVDVGGAGTSAAGHFVIDPDTTDYVVDPMWGGAISRSGLFVYGLRYDAANQRHNLTGLPRSEAMEYALLPGAARSVWYMTTDTITDRQTDRRAGTDGTVWLRASGEMSKRDLDTELESFGETFTFNNAHKLYAATIIGGMDFAAGTSGGYDYVLGGQLGYVTSSFDLDASESSGRMTGATGGVYGSVWNERFFIDTAFNANGLALDYDSPGLGAKTNTWLRSVGAKAETGMRYGLGERMYLEPLAAAAFVYTTFEEISLTGGEVQPDDAQSRRAALGLRFGGDVSGPTASWSYFVAGRAWNEFDGDSEGVVHNPGADLPFADDFSGTFSEFEAGLSIANDVGTLSGFVTSGVKAQDGYSAVDLSLGIRMRW